MEVLAFAPHGIEGRLVSVEVDIRVGLPETEIIGLPDNAVKEARERVRIGVKNSAYFFPADRIVINLAPAGLRKFGAAFDLAMAVGVLLGSGQVETSVPRVLIAGELELSGRVRPVHGIVCAVAEALKHGIEHFIVPSENAGEAAVLERGTVHPIARLSEIEGILRDIENGRVPRIEKSGARAHAPASFEDLADVRGHAVLKRAMEIAAAGGHHILLFGPPGCGKTMAARRFPSLLPDLEPAEAFIVTRIHSLAGLLPGGGDLMSKAPFRSPHHTSSLEGITGGGHHFKPGEVSLAHKGVLFLDEAPEFRKHILQALREPMEEGRIVLSRAGALYWFPAEFQLLLAANPCPCGNLGRKTKLCVCGIRDIRTYWRRIGGAVLDRIDLRVPVGPVGTELIENAEEESTESVRRRVTRALRFQAQRRNSENGVRNARMDPGEIRRVCALDEFSAQVLGKAVEKLGLSSRACHSVLKIARTIADLDGRETLRRDDVLEAIQHRRYGDDNFYWMK